MNNKLLRVLKKLYHHSNNDYDRERKVSIYKTGTLTPAEQELLHASGWVPNELQYIRHDEIIDKLIVLQTNPLLSWSSVGSAFIAGVGGSYPRGISSLASYHSMIHARAHAYEEAERVLACRVCAFSHSDEGWDNLSYIRYAMHLGNNYSGSSFGAYVDMTEFVKLLEQGPIQPTEKDKQAFSDLLHSLDRAEAAETPGKYEKRLTSEKIIKGHAGIRRGMLKALAMVGVIPNRILELAPDRWTDMESIINAEFSLDNTKGRSDMEMPWAGWQGSLGVDWSKARAIFGTIKSRHIKEIEK
ncbi:hypothetical protein J14TS5_46990 [Paenibacillus lautus]|uniref:hypothetical protein n=1 Tax=Paenibacillus lautus TaxID=1401 RepID=UPI001B2DC8C2|nr:hypothetical protein [Paenibacillus lautus]GIO99613.1 hypothetical protein J14TS5_46990 [Paenibacillus lautus]